MFRDLRFPIEMKFTFDQNIIIRQNKYQTVSFPLKTFVNKMENWTQVLFVELVMCTKFQIAFFENENN